MCEPEYRRLRPWRHDLAEEQLEIGDIGLEAVDMSFVPVGQVPPGQALAAPVQRGHGETPADQLANDLGGVFLDEFGASGQDQDGAARAQKV